VPAAQIAPERAVRLLGVGPAANNRFQRRAQNAAVVGHPTRCARQQ
jgi:hypothetical protein